MSKTKPQIIIIAGPNGAGKSTLAPYLLRDTFGLLEYVNADTIALGLSAFQPEKAAFEAGRIMLNRLNHLAERKVNFALESTLAGRSYVSWLKGLIEQGYSFHLLFLWLYAPELAIERVKERVRIGGHNIKEEVIRRRYIQGINNFLNLYQPIAETWGVYDNSAISNPILLATGSMNKELTVYDPELWQQFCGGKND